MGTAPIVIIGMHRSGTTILTRMLEDSGVYFGNIKDTNSESFFFQRLNNWIMRQSGTNWDSAEMEKNFDSEKEIEIMKVLAGQLRNIRRIEFLGWANLFKYSDIREIDFNWGWKDPRNTFTFSFWNH
ncbi:MAG: sulfotransferase, partial [Bacteroidetes bacterium]|nr:sulfotransferase [Bacteroidota bacterium]